MKKTRARFLSMLLSVCMVVSLLPNVAFAAEQPESSVFSDVTVSPSSAKAGDTVTVSATVKDQYASEITALTLIVYDGYGNPMSSATNVSMTKQGETNMHQTQFVVPDNAKSGACNVQISWGPGGDADFRDYLTITDSGSTNETDPPVIGEPTVSPTSARPGNSVTISVPVTDASAIKKVEIYGLILPGTACSLVDIKALTLQDANTYSYTFTVPENALNGNYKLIITASDEHGNSGEKDVTNALTVTDGGTDFDAPIIGDTITVNPTSAGRGKPVTVSVTITDASELKSVDCQVMANESFSIASADLTRQENSNTYQGTFTIENANTSLGAYDLKIMATDFYDNQAAKTFPNAFTLTAGGASHTQIVPAPISGVVSPAVGNAPQLTLPDTDQYSVSLEWRDPNGTFNGATFAPETVYRLIVVLNDKADYTFAGLTADALKGFTVNGITPSTDLVSDNQCVIQVTFPATGTSGGAPTVSGFTAERIGKTYMDLKFTPSTGGKYDYVLLSSDEAAPTDLGLLSLDLSGIVEEHSSQTNSIPDNALVLYLQIQNESGVKSQVYSVNIPAYTPSSSNVEINATNFPDENFRNWVLAQSYGSDNSLTLAEIAAITDIDLLNKGITDLTGLEHFTALTSFSCASNYLTSLPELPNGLTYLDCSSNQLTALPALPGGLKSLYFDQNKIETIPSLPTGLTGLSCDSNGLTDLPALPSGLTLLSCARNKLSGTLDISGQADMMFFYCQNNDLTGITLNGSAPYSEINVTQNLLESKDAVTGKSITWNDSTHKYSPQRQESTVTTADALAAALANREAQTIKVTENISLSGLSNTVKVGANHTLHIAQGKIVSTDENQLDIPDGTTLTLAGAGTLRSNNTRGGVVGIMVDGTLKLEMDSKLDIANNGANTMGVTLGVASTPGELVSEGGQITISNSGEYSTGISGASGSSDTAILKGGSLSVENTGGSGISVDELIVSDRCSVTVESGGDMYSYGLFTYSASFTDSTLRIANTAGRGLETDKLTAMNSTVTVANTASVGIYVPFSLGTDAFLLKSSTLALENTEGSGIYINAGSTMTVDNSTVTVANTGGTGLYLFESSLLVGINSGKLTLSAGATLGDVARILSDRGKVYKYSGVATVAAENGPASTEVLTAGDYVWNGTLFAKGDTTPSNDAQTPTITRQPQGATVKVGQSVTLSVEASVSDGGTLSYRWMGSSNPHLSGSEVSDTATFTPSTATVGTMYYHCIVTNTNPNSSGSKTAQLYSDQVAVTVQSGGSTGGGGGGSTGGGSGSSTGDSNTTVTTPPATTENPNPPTEATVMVKPTVSSSTVSATVSQKTVDNAIAKAQAEAKKNGTAENGIVVEIKVDTKNTKATDITTNLPKASVDTLVKAGIKELRITSEIADISLDLDTLKEIQKQIGSDISVTAKKVDNSTLSAEARKIVGDRPVYDLSITGTNGKKITDFGNGKVSVSIPYTLGANENAANVIAYYIDSTGKLTEMPNSAYDLVNQTLRFVTDHFSKFAVGYKTVTVNFTDITNRWAKDSIEFVAARGLLSGTGEGKFSPNTSMTRGMFVTALGRLAEIDATKYTKSSFTDVKADAYYMPYVEWASKNGIVSGIGDGKFAPDASITREQMAVIMQNYAKAIGFELPKVHAENSFADSAKISTWAKDAVKSMQMAGILAGKNGNLFDPQGTATRAEVSAVLKRFVELAISTDSAEGWALNDSGKWMYYENGKAVTGKKDIDGTTYTFDQYGVTADVPKNRKYTTYVVQKGDSFWRIAYNVGCTMAELEQLNNKSRFSIIYPGEEMIVPAK